MTTGRLKAWTRDLGVAAAGVAATTFVTMALGAALGAEGALILYVMPVVVAAVAAGTRSGLLALVLALLGSPEHYLLPAGVPAIQRALALAIFAIVSSAILVLVARLRLLEQAADARAQSERAAREAQQQALAHLRLAYAGAGLATWTHDPLTGATEWSPEVYDLIGADPTEPPSLDAWNNSIHEEDRAAVCAQFADELAQGDTVDAEFRIVRRDGSVRDVLTRGTILRDDNGRAVRVIGVNIDVTDRRATEQAKRRTERLFEAIYEHAPVSFWRQDFSSVFALLQRLRPRATSGWREFFETHPEAVDEALRSVRVVDVNARTLSMFGAPSREEFIHSFTRIFTPDSIPVFVEELIAIGEGRESLTSQVRLQGLDGRAVDAIFTILLPGPSRELPDVLVCLTDITQEKTFERQLLAARDVADAARRRLNEIVANVPGVVWEAWGEPDAATQRIDFVSDYVTTMLGYEPEDWLSQPNFWLKIVHPDDQERAAAEASAKFRSGVGGRSEFRWIRRDGTAIWVEAQSRVILDDSGKPVGMRGVTLDITERRRLADERAALAAEAQRSAQDAQFLARASDLLGASLDPEDTLQTIARLALPRLGDYCVVFGVRADGLHLAACAHTDPAVESRLRSITESILADPRLREATFAHRVLQSGDTLMIPIEPSVVAAAAPPELADMVQPLMLRSYLGVPMRSRGEIVGILTFGMSHSGRVHDALDRAMAQDLARRAAVAVENARLFTHVEQLNRIKDEFLATLSHELRTPLNAVLGWTRLLRAGTIPPERVPAALDTVERNAFAQQRLIEDLLDMSRVITGKLRLDVQPFDLRHAIDAAIDAVRPSAAAKSIDIVSRVTDVGPVEGDPQRLQQVIWNLLSNAVKFTPRFGRVEIFTRRVGDDVELVVSDTGQGIAPEVLPFIFERFWQADSSSTRAHAGLGLGLAIVRHIMELHGGQVEARSDGPGRGSAFRIKWPVSASPASPALGALHQPPGREGPPGRLVGSGLQAPVLAGLKVLLVEDDPDGAALAAQLLTDAGAEVTVAGSADQALARIERGSLPDVLVSDLAMPGTDGYALVGQLRAREAEAGGRIPAIAVSAYAQPSDRTRALVAGFQAHVAKPLDPAELVATIAACVSRGEPAVS